MSKEIINRVLSLGSDDLDPIVQAILNDDSATVTGALNCSSTGGPSVGNGTLAILKVSGKANTTAEPVEWSVVIKVVDIGVELESSHNNPRVEVEAYESGLLTNSRMGMRASRCYRVERLADNLVWLWIEDLSEWVGPPWDSASYLFASEQIGRFSGGWSIANLPSTEYFSEDPVSRRFVWSKTAKGFLGTSDLTAADLMLRNALPESSYRVALKLRQAVESAKSAVEVGPRTLVHGDCHPRNLFISPDGAGQRELVAFDWASIGTDHVASDIGTLIGGGLSWHEDEFHMIVTSEQQYFQAFLDGLAFAGWKGERDAARLGYLHAVCGYGMLLSMGAVILRDKLWRHDFVLARTGEQTAEAGFDSFARRIPLLEPLVDELVELVG
jgi:hypothetical protein